MGEAAGSFAVQAREVAAVIALHDRRVPHARAALQATINHAFTECSKRDAQAGKNGMQTGLFSAQGVRMCGVG